MLGGLGVAATASKLGYAGILTRLLPGHQSFSMGQLWGRRLFASAAALTVEVPVWVGTENGIRNWMGEKVDWSRAALEAQTRSAFLTLGLWRGAQGLGGRLAGLAGASIPTAHRIAALSGAAGIYGALGLQEPAGLQRDAMDRLLDTATFYLQAHGAGQLSQWILGRPGRALHHRLENLTRQREQLALQNFEWGSLPLAPVAVGSLASPMPARPVSSEAKTDFLVFSTANHPPQAPPKPQVIEERLEQMTRPDFSFENYRPKEAPPGEGPKKIRRLAVALSGGNSSAENAAIYQFVMGAKDRRGDLEIVGIIKGLEGLVDPRGEFPRGRIWPLQVEDVAGEGAIRQAYQRLLGVESLPPQGNGLRSISQLGGDLLQSGRYNPLAGDPTAQRVKATMKEYGIDALAILGGNGSQRAAAELAAQQVPLVFLPQSIDADVPGSVISIGFPSAVNRGARGVYEMMNTAHCGNRFLVEVMGQKYGLLALAIGLNARKGHYFMDGEPGPPVRVESVFTEIPRSFEEVPQLIEHGKKKGHHHGVILFSEGVRFKEFTPARGEDAAGRMLIDNGDVVKQIRRELAERNITDVRTFAMGYTLRGTKPSEHDIQLAYKMVGGALGLVGRGAFGRMVGLDFLPKTSILTMVYPPLQEAIRQPKQLDPDFEGFVRNYLENNGS
jgi:6-phosphofructokinase 1